MDEKSGMIELCKRAVAIVEKDPEMSFDDVRRILMRLELTPRQTEWDTGTVILQLGGLSIRVLKLERIIASKKATNRDKDRLAVSVLETTLKVASGEGVSR
jgi:hypothetical protein